MRFAHKGEKDGGQRYFLSHTFIPRDAVVGELIFETSSFPFNSKPSISWSQNADSQNLSLRIIPTRGKCPRDHK